MHVALYIDYKPLLKKASFRDMIIQSNHWKLADDTANFCSFLKNDIGCVNNDE